MEVQARKERSGLPAEGRRRGRKDGRKREKAKGKRRRASKRRRGMAVGYNLAAEKITNHDKNSKDEPDSEQRNHL